MCKLIWKEWHEQSWKLAFSSLVLAAMAFIGLHARIVEDDTMILGVCLIGLVLLPVLSSTGLLPAERGEGSLESLLSLPVAPWKILFAKTLMGVVLCAGPMIAAAAVSLLAAGGREMLSGDILDIYARTTLAILALFIWMMALTSRLPNETRAGLISLGVLIFWTLATIGLAQSIDLHSQLTFDARAAHPILPPTVYGISPLAFVYGYSAGYVGAPRLTTVLFMQLFIAAALWAWMNRLFGKSIEERS